MRKDLILLACFLAVACGGRGPKVPAAPQAREFPAIEVPSVYTDPEERIGYVAAHFWDRFLDTNRVYVTDSLYVNGVKADALENQFGTFITLVGMVPLPAGKAAVDHLFSQAEIFGHKDLAVFNRLSEWVRKYLYDPNSPVRSEDLFLPWLQRLSVSPLVDTGLQPGYAWEAQLCALNGIGTKAADFSFTDTKGHRRTLYSIQANLLLLVFGNPGCHACKELTEQMGADPAVSALIRSGALKIVDVYIDEDIADWKAHIPEYPVHWINGYDHDFRIRQDLIYHVRGIPSIYLLDASKTVILKDAPTESVLQVLSSL